MTTCCYCDNALSCAACGCEQPDDTVTAEAAWQELLDKDDRTSPEEYSEMCLITSEELADFMLRPAKPKIEWAVNVLLETIATKFEANETFDLWRSDAAALVRSFKHVH